MFSQRAVTLLTSVFILAAGVANGATYVAITDRAKQPEVLAFIVLACAVVALSSIGGICYMVEQHRKGGVL